MPDGHFEDLEVNETHRNRVRFRAKIKGEWVEMDRSRDDAILFAIKILRSSSGLSDDEIAAEFSK